MSSSRTTSPGLERFRRALIEAARHCAGLGYHAALAGNVSVRVSEDLLLCTRHGADKGSLTPEDLVLCDFSGRKIEGKGEPTSEINMHRLAYAMRPEVESVIHAHPPTATAFAAASVPLDQLQLPEMLVLLGPVALVPYATPASGALVRHLERFLPDHDAFLLENHGALTVGRSARQAALRMELLEHNARITLTVQHLGKPFRLAAEEREVLMGFRQRMAMWACEEADRQEP